ncbi:uncharacterized protein G2W53_044127 [Senna tora]|uniref:Uncharacterized protein n=1 Tax=Senna tora TaxID=362788 RepID=A0A834SKE9_9FABA|nr:uncharacterized protein G2W53_044127 [Senna tora]
MAELGQGHAVTVKSTETKRHVNCTSSLVHT